MNKMIEKTAKILAGVGALNWGTAKFVGIDVLSYVPAGIATTVAVGAIGLSGAVVLYLLFKKKI